MATLGPLHCIGRFRPIAIERRDGFGASVVVSVAMMGNVEDFAAWIEESDRELKAWLEVEAEQERLISWLIEQTEIVPLEAFR